MKKQPLALRSSEYVLLHKGFIQWLGLLNYSELGIPGLNVPVKNFLCYQERHGKPALQQLTAGDGDVFIRHLQEKTGERTGRPFSAGYINKHIQALRLLSRYLQATGRSDTGFTLGWLEDARGKPVWLTKPEISALYEATADSILGIRDRAMLAVYYGCGLRLNEGACLEVKDLDMHGKILHVRKGKGYKERFVPVAAKDLERLQMYLDYARPQLLQACKTDAFFIEANKGRPLSRQGLYIRIKALSRKANIKKRVGTHTLRHSIATHLLQNGMKLEKIQEFLGHRVLDSTQIYTHLVNEAQS